MEGLGRRLLSPMTEFAKESILMFLMAKTRTAEQGVRGALISLKADLWVRKQPSPPPTPT